MSDLSRLSAGLSWSNPVIALWVYLSRFSKGKKITALTRPVNSNTWQRTVRLSVRSLNPIIRWLRLGRTPGSYILQTQFQRAMVFGFGTGSTLASSPSSSSSSSTTPVAPRLTTDLHEVHSYHSSDTTTLLGSNYDNNEPRGLLGFSSHVNTERQRLLANMKPQDGEELGEGRPPVLNVIAPRTMAETGFKKRAMY